MPDTPLFCGGVSSDCRVPANLQPACCAIAKQATILETEYHVGGRTDSRRLSAFTHLLLMWAGSIALSVLDGDVEAALNALFPVLGESLNCSVRRVHVTRDDEEPAPSPVPPSRVN